MKKLIALAFVLGLSAIASFACPCTGDASPCQCGPGCKTCSESK